MFAASGPLFHPLDVYAIRARLEYRTALWWWGIYRGVCYLWHSRLGLRFGVGWFCVIWFTALSARKSTFTPIR